MSRKAIFEVLNRFKVGGIAKSSHVVVKNTKSVNCLLTILYAEGFISAFYLKNKYEIVVFLKYVNGLFLMKNMRVYSNNLKPAFFTYKKLCSVFRGPQRVHYFAVLSTSRGLLSLEEIFLSGVPIGGELLFTIDLS
jgi:ribosomal protein S8